VDPLSKIQKLLDKFNQGGTAADVATIAAWQKQVERSLLIGDLEQHEGVKLWLKEIQNDLDDMSFLLLHADSKALPDAGRDRLLDRKVLYEKFRDFFHIASTSLNATVKEIDSNFE